MKASLDTNIIIHFYRAGLQDILFNFFDSEVLIHEKILDIELENHGQDIIELINLDIKNGNIELYTNQRLRDLEVDSMFDERLNDNMMLYSPQDMGEMYAISLAQTLGACSLVTDDMKQGGPYMSLLQFEDEVIPFNFADILILRYLEGGADENQTILDFKKINEESRMNWTLKSQLVKFYKRFYLDPFFNDKEWINNYIKEDEIYIKEKLTSLNKLI
ncbi:PIN domain-containing protein [Gemella sanguinis]|uniref:PIN domain-containing protein n=1 Tax=Gemella sanguinis TaxID=84135 RepID=UPI0028D189E2|nr:PIN domain-containing protein [Gemella sanguinis]